MRSLTVTRNGSSPFARFLCAVLPRYQLLRARKFRFTSLCVLSQQTINLYTSCHGLWYRKGEIAKKKKKKKKKREKEEGCKRVKKLSGFTRERLKFKPPSMFPMFNYTCLYVHETLFDATRCRNAFVKTTNRGRREEKVKTRKKFLKKEKQGRTKKTQLAYLGTKAHSNHEPINQLVRFLELISI